MTREAINEAALRGQLRSEDSEDEDSDADDHIRHHSPESERLSSRQASSPDVPIADTTIQQLFSYTSEYQPEAIELFPELKCFVPDYIPAIGDIDPMIKVSPFCLYTFQIPAPPSSVKDDAKGPIDPELGLVVLDEPATKQSDPAVLDLQLRAASKGLGSNNKAVANEQAVRSITLGSGAQGQVGQKALNQWVQNVYDLHVHKPPDRVEYSKRMPDIEKLMQEWPPSIDVALSTNSVSLALILILADQASRRGYRLGTSRLCQGGLQYTGYSRKRSLGSPQGRLQGQLALTHRGASCAVYIVHRV